MECYGLTRTPHYGYWPYRQQHSSPPSTWQALVMQYFPVHEGFVVKRDDPVVHNSLAHGGQYEARGYDTLTVHSASTGTHLTLIAGQSAFKGTDWPMLMSRWPRHDARAPRVSFAGIVQGDMVQFYAHHPRHGLLLLGLRGLYEQTIFSTRTDAPRIHEILAQFRGFARTPERAAETTLEARGLDYNRRSGEEGWRTIAKYLWAYRSDLI
ncbi:uncharacterized protein BO95DRAFT_469272 [Aspergillus brunneoviolaceus CBS 621.78]|uniref:Uncharacterized protein n=1 Tax=Aspergillus brunneoviolaceus CBS 621.78 TaxID=1450534 RepID=A0ACD1FSI7_9EURO|nr:hypothetical protein BO95DRAFT_469272 [Aspergillus brunneoviolaceus CBS 621.78]RAH39950.1 hypothetical protein BO95DRAFT_469272 [Aspergillus brunneoviolaceus CBS 621.78]